ncbi:MAG TPA: hypothetical protein VD815_05530 [Candidatus Saccharimonadales bacterium]|nr:hypothetical protein [Candidatus Saccharimonadales bacterium]
MKTFSSKDKHTKISVLLAINILLFSLIFVSTFVGVNATLESNSTIPASNSTIPASNSTSSIDNQNGTIASFPGSIDSDRRHMPV